MDFEAREGKMGNWFEYQQLQSRLLIELRLGMTRQMYSLWFRTGYMKNKYNARKYFTLEKFISSN